MTPEEYRRRRHALGLTQAQAGARARLSRETFNAIENGRRGVGVEVAARLAEALGGDAADYITETRRPVESAEDMLTRLRAGELIPRETVLGVAADVAATAQLLQELAASLRKEVDEDERSGA